VAESRRLYLVAAVLAVICLCIAALGVVGPGLMRLLRGSPASTPDFDATLQALIAETIVPGAAATPLATATTPPGSGEPSGKIVYTCKDMSGQNICIMNADGSGLHRLTPLDGYARYYASLAPDGESVVYSQYREANVYEIYEMAIATGVAVRLTDRLGVSNSPEISPDGKSIVFMRDPGASDQYQIWLMNRDGSNQRRLFSGRGWDPTWSPDGSQILFASDMDGTVQLYRIDLDGSNPKRISDLPAIRGRSDWSSQGMIATYSGQPWKREVYIMRADGSEARRVSPPGGNSQGPSFSPDGDWLAFTSYFDKNGDDLGCEIYIIRVDGTDLRRLTNNDFCDYQPRWGP